MLDSLTETMPFGKYKDVPLDEVPELALLPHRRLHRPRPGWGGLEVPEALDRRIRKAALD